MVDDQSLLFDCGPGVAQRLLESGASPREIDKIFLTHLHYDHFVDYAYIVLNRWDQGVGRLPELHVYGPPPLARVTQQLFGEGGAFDPDLTARTRHPGSEFVYERRGGILPRLRPQPEITEVMGGSVIKEEAWQLTVAEVMHVQPQLTCLAYRIDTADGAIVFGGDTAPVASLTNLARGARVLIHMCHFLNGLETDPRITGCCSGHLDAANTAREADVDILILTHITEPLEQPGVRERLIAEVSEVFSGQLIFGEDLLEIPVKGIEPEPIR
jgi:ribonuclease BN (tRNA processing enzyme)